MALTYIEIGGSGSGSGGGFANPATANLNMGAFDIIQSGSNNVWTLFPLGGTSDDAPQIIAALDACKAAGGGIVRLSPETFLIKSDILPTTHDYMCGVNLVGSGEETVLNVTAGISTGIIRLAGQSFGATKAVNNVTAGDATITMTTASDATLFTVGDILALKGTDSESLVDVEVRKEVTAINTGTGVLTLREPVFKTMTSVSIADTWGSDDNAYSTMRNSVRNLTIELNYTPGAAIYGILAVAQKDFLVEDIIFRGFASNVATNGNAPLSIQQSLTPMVRRVTVEGSKNQGIVLQQSYMGVVEDCLVDTAMTSTSTAMPIDLNGSYDCQVVRCSVNRGLGVGGGIGFSGTSIARRNKVLNCTVSKTVSYGVKLTNALNTLVSGNHFESTADSAVYIDGKRNIVANNTFNRCLVGGQFVGANSSYSQFVNNVVSNSGSYGVFASSGAVGGSIQGNVFNLGGGNDPCISPITCSSFNISNNVISSWTGKGIYLQTSCIDNLLDGNMIYSTSSDGIKLDDGCTNNMISMNHMRGLTLTQGAGAGNDFISNKVT